MITGNDLIELGYKPDKWFGHAIEVINVIGEDWTNKEIREFCDTLLPPPEILTHAEPKSYSLNLEANTPDEVRNMGMVIETMDELMKVPTITGGAIMPDACPTGKVGQIPVGGVAVAENAIHPNMHSADICCSVMATCLGNADPKHVMDVAEYATHFGWGGRSDGLYNLPNNLNAKFGNNIFLNTPKTREMSRTHLGTQGDGNHFLFVGRSDSTGETFLVTHHGSRGVGAQLFKEGMKVAERFRKKLSPKTDKINAWIPYDTPEGKDYWKALQIVREWTKLNHQVIHDKIAEIVGVTRPFSFWNEHNFVFKDGINFYHAKGATPLLEEFVPDGLDNLRLVPLNMAEPILVVQGDYNSNNLGFAPHGAGRNISRSEHKRRIEATGFDANNQVYKETEGLDIRFFSGKPDVSELPSAYKSAGQVQDQMRKFDLGEVMDKIMPYGSIMAGEQDAPWKNKKKKK